MVHQIDQTDNRDRLEALLDRNKVLASKRRRGRDDSDHPEKDVRYDNRSLILGMGLATMLGLGAFAAGELAKSAVPSITAPPVQATVAPPIVANNSRIAGLSEERSVITGIVDPESMTASYYWTFVVGNSTNKDQETQIEMELPDHATVSRATLWIDGKPEEAAFGETWRVQQAYKWITKLHRDPLLVTQTAPGRVLIKAAPVKPNSQMEFRIGITAAGHLSGQSAEFAMPHVVSSNLGDSDFRTDVHIQSPVPLSSNNSLIQTLVGGTNYLTRGSTYYMEDLTLRGVRSSLTRKFAARATHSFPAEYIVGSTSNVGNPARELNLSKEPAIGSDCRYISDEDVAHRMSTLWAYSEIENLAKQGRNEEAGQLANAYRVVSSVSGATVLEMESDYQYNGLNRDRYKTLSYSGSAHNTDASQATATQSYTYYSGGQDAFASRGTAGDGTQSYFDDGDKFNTSSQRQVPNLQGATNGTIGPQGSDATVINGVNTAGTVRVNNLANAEAALNIASWFSGPTGAPVANWLVASSRDANLFSDAGPTSMIDQLMSGPAGFLGAIAMIVVFLGGVFVNFAGPVTTFRKAIIQTRAHDPEAGSTAALGFAWLTFAFILPLFSQMAYIYGTIKHVVEKRKVRAKPATG